MIGLAVRMGVLGMVAVLGTAACTPPSVPVGVSTGTGVRLRGDVPAEPVTLPAETLTDTSGAPYPLTATATAAAAEHGRVTVIFFGYTHCPEVCTTALADVALALRRVSPDVRRQVRVLFITVDPERDTPAVMRAYLDRLDRSFVGLTGSAAKIAKLAQPLGVALTGKRDIVGSYQVGHGAQLIGFDAAHSRRVIWPEGTPVADLAHDITALVKENG